MILYIEQQILHHPRTIQVCNYFPKSQKIIIQHYKNIFDKNFPRIRKEENNILVLAQLTGDAISKAPDGYGHAGE